jgi:hypothetical protein
MITISTDLAYIILFSISIYAFSRLYKYIIFPKILEKTTKEFDKNPKWITNELHAKYYGFNDIDFITAENAIGALPRFRVPKNDKTRLEILIPNDTSIRDIEQMGQVALVGKIKIKYGLFFPDKPIHWLSVLCFMLDGGEINVKEIEKRQETN